MLHDILKKLRSDYRSIRELGWTELRDESAAHQIELSDNLHCQVREILDDESDDGVREIGLRVLRDLPHSSPPGPPHFQAKTEPAQSRNAEKPLAEWIWDPFHRPSAVFGVAAGDNQKRDEHALIALARMFPYTEFPDTEIDLVRLKSEDWRERLHERHVQSVCFVGRLALYGEEAMARWGNPGARFTFRRNDRPRSLPHGKLHRNYHCIVERIGEEETEEYRSSDQGGTRTDYALVQRYTVVDGAKHIVVVSVAGATALGTEAVAKWLARDLREAIDPCGKSPITTPQGIRWNSRMEALVKVTEHVATLPWKVTHVELQQLLVDKYCWSKEERHWHILPPRTITLIRKNGKITDVWFDGKSTRMTKRSQMFRLLVEASLAAGRERDQVIDVIKLAKNDKIWAGKSVTEKDARRQISLLKTRYLGQAITGDQQLRLQAAVEIRDV